jgi:hypothetical protein
MAESLMQQGPPEPDEVPDIRRPSRLAGMALLGRLLAYHFTLTIALLAFLAFLPDISRHLPIGGISDLAQAASADLEAGNSDSRTQHDPESSRLGHASQLVIVLGALWLLMIPVAWVHKGIHRSHAHDHSLDETALILPGVVAAIVLVVQHSLALAFSLAGIVAGVHFRRALQDTFDALFILVAIGAGIAAGVRALEIAAVLTIFFSYATLYVYYFGDGLESDFLAYRQARKRARRQARGVEPPKPGG